MRNIKNRESQVRKPIFIIVILLSLLLWNIPSHPPLGQPTKIPTFLKANSAKSATEPSKTLCNDDFRQDPSCRPSPQATSTMRCICPTPTPTPTTIPNTSTPKSNLIFDDEFSSKSLDMEKWNIEDNSAEGYHNCCLGYGVQYYTPEALSFWQGSLRITTRAQDVYGYHYTSGAINTENKFSFKYGRVDIRARLPQTTGSWPALWLLATHTVGRASFEIDMVEMIGSDPNTVHMTNHWGTQHEEQVFSSPNFSQYYHVFSIIWTSQAISWYIDGVQHFELEQGISNQSMYLIINSSLGGSWPGNPDGSTVLPQYMDVDYVRIYGPAS